MYALGLTIKHKGSRYAIIQDRIITHLSELSDDEFYFDKVDGFYFVTQYKNMTNGKSIGLWHTTINNLKKDINNISLKITHKNIGAFLTINKKNIIQGYIINNQVFSDNPEDVNLDNIAESNFKIRRIKEVKTPIQIQADNRRKNKNRLLAMLVIWVIIAGLSFSYYQYFISQNQQAFNHINFISKQKIKYQKILNSQKIIDLSQSPYLGFHKDAIINYLSCTPAITGEISFLNKIARLKIINNSDVGCLSQLGFKIEKLTKNNIIAWGIK